MAELNSVQMDEKIWNLTTAQAQAVLDAFLATERREFPNYKIDSIALDYSPESVALALKYISENIKTGLLTQDEQNLWFMRMGYYFGEALCRQVPGLFWRTGNVDYGFANHPVIAGFTNDEEAAVITICRNVALAVALDGAAESRIENAVKLWFETPLAR